MRRQGKDSTPTRHEEKQQTKTTPADQTQQDGTGTQQQYKQQQYYEQQYAQQAYQYAQQQHAAAAQHCPSSAVPVHGGVISDITGKLNLGALPVLTVLYIFYNVQHLEKPASIMVHLVSDNSNLYEKLWTLNFT